MVLLKKQVSSSNLEKIMTLLEKYMLLKAIKKIQIDPKLETADIDVTNNTWPRDSDKFD
jgi:hypothetical protein